MFRTIREAYGGYENTEGAPNEGFPTLRISSMSSAAGRVVHDRTIRRWAIRKAEELGDFAHFASDAGVWILGFLFS